MRQDQNEPLDNWIKIRFLCTSLGFDVNLWLIVHWDKLPFCVHKFLILLTFAKFEKISFARNKKFAK